MQDEEPIGYWVERTSGDRIPTTKKPSWLYRLFLHILGTSWVKNKGK